MLLVGQQKKHLASNSPSFFFSNTQPTWITSLSSSKEGQKNWKQ